MPKIPRAVGVERGCVRFATPYLEVESQSTPSLERAVARELGEPSRAATPKKQKGCDQLCVQTVLASPP